MWQTAHPVRAIPRGFHFALPRRAATMTEDVRFASAIWSRDLRQSAQVHFPKAAVQDDSQGTSAVFAGGLDLR